MALSRISEETRRHVAFGAIAIIGSLIFLLMPLLIGEFDRTAKYTSSQLGMIGSAPMFGMFFGAIGASFFVKNLLNCGCVLAVIIMMMSSYLVFSMFPALFIIVVVSLFFAGVAGAVLMGVGFAVMSLAANPDRVFAIWISMQLVAASLVIGPFSKVFDAFSVKGGGLALVAVTLCAILPLGLVSALGSAGRCVPDAGSGPAKDKVYSIADFTLALVAITFFGIGIMVVWPFAEGIGETLTGSLNRARSGISLSLLAGILGALAISVLAGRISRLTLLMLATMVGVVGLVFFLLQDISYSFLFAIIAFSMGWNATPASQIGVMSSLDPTGHLVVASIAALKLGYAIGPLLGGLLGGADNIVATISVSSAFLVASAGIFVWLGKRYNQIYKNRTCDSISV